MTKIKLLLGHQQRLYFFYGTHIQKTCGLPTTSRPNKYNVSFPRDKDVKVDVKNGIYYMKNQLKKAMFKYDREGRLCLGITRVGILDGNITDNPCPVFDYT